MTWQPIATAPKDGTNVLVWCPDRRIPVAATWQTAEFYWVELYQGSVNPTHWMPLPDPPDDGQHAQRIANEIKLVGAHGDCKATSA